MINEAYLPPFTVLMAVYAKDDPILFDRALSSVFTNSLAPTEVMVVVDGPIGPALDDVLGRHAAPSLRVVRLDDNRGLARALNAGLDLVRTEWVVRADADDINIHRRFELLSSHMSGVDIVGSQILEIEADGAPVAIRTVPLDDRSIRAFARRRNPFNHMTVAYRASLARECGGYPTIHLREDYGLWALMLARGARAANLAECLVHASAGTHMYRRRGGLRYALAEAQLQRLLVRCGLKGPLSGFVDGCGRSLVFLLPVRFRAAIYERFLRGARP